ncbi:adenylyl cyclase [Rathayibacter sp. YIM 133350]|uniref:OmpL47-type beta-barrel domain-containing protein n=1 Tax=Rathayibacter sp. YIM 133350 TaxID=3131992 RepID=UPI00307D1389
MKRERALLGAAAAIAAVVASSIVLTVPASADAASPDFGPNVTVFDPSWSTDDINAAFLAASHESEFSLNRHAFFFKPGSYGSAAGQNDPANATDIVNGQIGYYTSVAGLGATPDDVTINGAIHSEGRAPADRCPWDGGEGDTALTNFWRSLSNIAINPIQRPVADDTGIPGACYPPALFPEGGADPHQLRWAVSQAAPLRRVHVEGNLSIFPHFGGYSSGGYLSDSKVDGTLQAGSQQQWYTRDSSIGGFDGGAWNMVFSGTQGAPAQNFAQPLPNGGTGIVTALPTTSLSRPAPYLYLDGDAYKVFVPKARTASSGPDWSTDAAHGDSIGIGDFYIAHEGDSAATINAALASGKNLLLTPGVYHLADSLKVNRADTVVLGIGLASLTPDNGTAAIEVGDVSGVKIAGITVDAGVTNSSVLVKVGPTNAAHSVAADPTTLSDVFIRVGGPWAGNATTSIEVNSDNVLLDHIWAWRADHGLDGSGTWTGSRGDHGLVVNGDDVTATGLFVEHYQKNQVLWNGNGGSTTFYQSEIPYEVPDQGSWTDGGRNGYASYRVADTVTSHHAVGLGIYSYFNQGVPVLLESAIQAPKSKNVTFASMTTVFLSGSGGISHVINDAGAPVIGSYATSQLASYPPADVQAPTVSIAPSPESPDGANGWYRTPVTLTVVGSDDFTPGPHFEASVDGGAWKPVTGPITLKDGSHTVKARAIDDSGNVSETITWGGKVDTVAPKVKAGGSGGTLTLTGTDAGSGVRTIQYALVRDLLTNPNAWSTYTGPVTLQRGLRVVVFRATDEAGNVSRLDGTIRIVLH